jgi:hypothetical protein
VELLRDLISDALQQEMHAAFTSRRENMTLQTLLCPSTDELRALQQTTDVLCRGMEASVAFEMQSFAGASLVSAKSQRLKALVASSGGVDDCGRQSGHNDARRTRARDDEARPHQSMASDAVAARRRGDSGAVTARWWAEQAQSYRVMSQSLVSDTLPSLVHDLSVVVQLEADAAAQRSGSDSELRRSRRACVDALLQPLAGDCRVTLLEGVLADMSDAHRDNAAGGLVTITFPDGVAVQHASLLMLGCLLRAHRRGSPTRSDGDGDDVVGSSRDDAAVFPDDAAVVHWLVRHGADPLHILEDGRSALHFAAERVCRAL